MRLVVPRVLATASSALPSKPKPKVVTVPLTLNKNITESTPQVLANAAKARAANLPSGVSTRNVFARQTSTQVTNNDIYYSLQVAIGGNTWKLDIDTGSSNLWCGARTACEPTSTGQDTGNTFKIGYITGGASGEEYTDNVGIAGLTVTGQGVGANTPQSSGGSNDGIIGFGPTVLTQGTVSNTGTVPTVMDNLFNQGLIPAEVLGVYLEPESGSDNDDTNGELTLGGYDSSKFSSNLYYFPKVDASACPYWCIAVEAIYYGSTSDQLNSSSSTNGIIDTGTTLLALVSPAYNDFLTQNGGSVYRGFSQFNTAPTGDLEIAVGGVLFQLQPEMYLVPQAQYGEYGLDSSKYYAYVSDSGSTTYSILGQKFIENYSVVLDTGNNQIGIAASNYS